MTIPPTGTSVEQKMVDDSIPERGSKNLSDDWMESDERDPWAGMVAAFDDLVTKVQKMLDIMKLELMLIGLFAFSFSCLKIGVMKA